MRDKLGQPILVGSYIAYGHALGRCAAIKIGRVLKVATLPKKELSSVSPHRITVVGIDDDLVWVDPKRYPPKLSKVGTLMYPDRVIILKPSIIPTEYRALLDAFEWDQRKGK